MDDRSPSWVCFYDGGFGLGCCSQRCKYFQLLLLSDTVVSMLISRQHLVTYNAFSYDLIGCPQQSWEVGIFSIFQILRHIPKKGK